MSTTVTIVLIVVILLVLAAVVLGIRAARRRKLQQTFGPEYDRVVADTGNRTEAERELVERQKRHAQLELKPLSPESRSKYATAWEEVQIRFVDNPKEAVGTADQLVTALIGERGYPTGDYDDRLADLSVEHASTLEHYRAAHDISRRSSTGEAGTEDLRQALVHYRALFADLLGEDPVGHPTPGPRSAADDHVDPSDARRPTVTDTEGTATEPGVARSRPDAPSR